MRQFMHSFVGYEAPSEILDGVRSGQITSFCLFSDKNVQSPEQLRALTASLYQAAKDGNQPPPLIGIDQEGGQLMAVNWGVTDLPGNMALGATRSTDLARAAGRVLGMELLAMGVNLNFAPALDVNNNPLNPVIGARAFGDNPEMVSLLGTALIDGMQAVGVMATAKHFPGHGDTANDTHHQDVIIPHSKQRIDNIELRPFYDAADMGVEAIMTAHIRLLAYDADNPATLSRAIILQLLREKMGYKGLVITDAMDMQAVSKLGTDLSVRAALEAGNDLILLGHVENQLELARLFAGQERIPSLQRIDKARRGRLWELPDLSILNSTEHQQVARQIAEQSITVVRGEKNLPLRPSDDDIIAVIVPETVNLTPADTSASVRVELGTQIAKRHPNTQIFELPHQIDGRQTVELAQQIEQAKPAYVIMGTIDAPRSTPQTMLVSELQQRGLSPIVISMRTPYDIMVFPNIDTYICTYSIRPVSMEAAAKVLFGELQPVGELPCKLPGVSNMQKQI